jgi:hypothetical protein
VSVAVSELSQINCRKKFRKNVQSVQKSFCNFTKFFNYFFQLFIKEINSISSGLKPINYPKIQILLGKIILTVGNSKQFNPGFIKKNHTNYQIFKSIKTPFFDENDDKNE